MIAEIYCGRGGYDNRSVTKNRRNGANYRHFAGPFI